MMENENLLPKNIRQIGEIQGRLKICLEDYVMTYIRKMESRESGNYLGILLGERQNTEDAEYVFVRGIMEAPDFLRMKEENAAEKKESVAEKKTVEAPVLKNEAGKHQNRYVSNNDGEKKEKEHPGLWQAFQKRYGTAFEQCEGAIPNEKTEEKATGQSKHHSKEESEKESKDNSKDRPKENGSESDKHASVESVDPWQAWKQEQERHFPGWEIQGCCVIGTYPSGQLEELSLHFPEAAQMLYHLQDQEERLYWQKGEQYEGVRGYFIFYEQNQVMQEYLSELFGGGSVEKEGGSDGAIISFREKVRSKAEEKSQSFLRLASSFFVVGVLLVGAIVVNRVSDMREVQSVSGTGQISAVSKYGDASDDSGSTLDEEVAVDASETVDARTVSDSGVENANVTEEAAGEAVSVSGESTLAGSDAFWADGEDDAKEATADTVESESTGTATESNAGTNERADSAAESSTGTAESEESVMESSADATGTAAETALAAEETAEEATSRQIQAAYVIREGDTLAEICARYYGSLERMEELCEANGIEDANLILPGQKIVLP